MIVEYCDKCGREITDECYVVRLDKKCHLERMEYATPAMPQMSLCPECKEKLKSYLQDVLIQGGK